MTPDSTTGGAVHLPADPLLGDVLPFLLIGLLVVVGTLAFLAMCAAASARVCRVMGIGALRAPVAGAPPPATDKLPAEQVVVIAAAVAAVIDGEHRVLHIRRLDSGDWNWSMEGRFKHHASHQVR